MSNITIFTSGTSFMNTGSPFGPLIALKRFVPVYDWRIDPTVLPTSALMAISAADPTSATSTYGEIIYNIDELSTSAYTMSGPEFLLYYPGQTGTTTIAGSPFNDLASVTLLNGRPLSPIVSGASLTYSYPNWNVTTPVQVSGNNNVPTGYSSTLNRFFDTISFAPISSAAGGTSRGVFSLRINNQKGNFKFNKLAIYAVRMTSGGVEDTSVAPVLFAVAALNQPIIKANDGSNINYFEADIELQFSSNGYYSQVTFTDNQNWRYTAGQQTVYFLGRAILGTSAVPGSYIANAKLHLVENNVSVPMTRFSDDNANSYVDEYYTSLFGNYGFDSKIGSYSREDFSFKTSGTTNFERAKFSLDATTFQRDISLNSTSVVSGTHSSGMVAKYYGYVDNLSFYTDSVYLATFRGKLATYASIVLGNGSNTLYEDPTHFLTVHGGSLLVGSNTLSGNATITQNLVMNGVSSNITFSDNSTHQISSYGLLNIVSIYDMALVTTTNNIIFRPSLNTIFSMTPNDVSAFGNFYVNGTINGTNGMILSGSAYIYGNLIFPGSPGTPNTTTITSYNQLLQYGPSLFTGNITALLASFTSVELVNMHASGNVSANGGYWELGRTQANGRWIDFSPTFTATLGTITGVTITTARYSVIGKKLYIQLWAVMTCSNASNPTIAFTIPGSFLAGPNAQRSSGMMMFPSGQGEILYADMNAGGSTISFNRLGNPVGSAYGSASFFMIGNISLEIQ